MLNYDHKCLRLKLATFGNMQVIWKAEKQVGVSVITKTTLAATTVFILRSDKRAVGIL